MAFPRFFFLSNDELLSILAQSREVTAVQKHLSKCFEGIHSVTFEDNLTISRMNSSMNESVKFLNAINPFDREKNPRGVEEWLLELERNMKETIKDLFVKSLKDYAATARAQWLFAWPS